jgi:hypothetical protein
MIAASEKFLAKHLGGRYQESMTPEVSQRLKEITVDVKTVELKKKAEATASAPKPAVELQPGTLNYKASIEVGGQTIPLSVTSEVKEESGAWVVTESAKMPQGDITDRTTIEKGSLVLMKRWIKQGPLEINLEFKDQKATGTMSMNGQTRPVSADIGGVLFADGAGAHNVMASLPLTEGYTTTFRNFDVQTQKVKLMQLKVVGMEKVSVAGGSFDAIKLEVTSAEGEGGSTTIWVDKQSRKVLKATAILPQMNGAVVTSELVGQ